MVVGFTTDAAPVMRKFIKCLPIEIVHQECYAHAIHLAIVDCLYKKKDVIEAEPDIEAEVDIENEFSDDDVEVNVEIDIEPELNKNLGEIITKIRKIVKQFRHSPVKNDTHLQPHIVRTQLRDR